MALEKINSTQFEIATNGTVFVITKTKIVEDGTVISIGEPHRRSITPDADLSGEDANTKAICEASFTDEVKSAYEAQKEKSAAKLEADLAAEESSEETE